jgi:hypothetical protein
VLFAIHFFPKYAALFNLPRTQHSVISPSAAARGYDSRWARFARTYKRVHPLCVVCELEGRTKLTDVPHHLEPVASGGELYPGDEGLLPVCNRCHQRVEKLGHGWRKAVKTQGQNAYGSI